MNEPETNVEPREFYIFFARYLYKLRFLKSKKQWKLVKAWDGSYNHPVSVRSWVGDLHDFLANFEGSNIRIFLREPSGIEFLDMVRHA